MATQDQIREFIEGIWTEYVEVAQHYSQDERLWKGDIVKIGKRLVSLHCRAHALAEEACNRELSESEKKEDKLLDTKALQTVERLGKGFGLTIQGDPRGSVYKLIVPSGKGYDWGNEGRPVPTRRKDYY
jgi:hypothetical protein